MMYQVSGADQRGDFTAGLVVTAGKITSTAPKLGYMKGWSIERVREYCQRRGWQLTGIRPVTMNDIERGVVPQVDSILVVVSEAPGAWKNGTAVVKVDGFEHGKGHPLGSTGVVVGSVGGEQGELAYFVEWDDDRPQLPSLCQSWKLKKREMNA